MMRELPTYSGIIKAIAALCAILLSPILVTASSAGDASPEIELSDSETGAGAIQSPDKTWNYKRIHDRGWSADRLFDEAVVIGTGDEPIGDLENIIIGNNGDIEALILEIGGIFDIGDTHVALPWNEAKIDDDLRRVVTPIVQDNVADYSLFKTKWFTQADVNAKQVVESDLWTGAFLWKATKLLNEYVYLRGGEPFGYVSDLIFVDGELEAVVIDTAPGYGGGLKAVPYGAFAPTIGRPRFSSDYDEADLASLEPFDYDRMPEKVEINP